MIRSLMLVAVILLVPIAPAHARASALIGVDTSAIDADFTNAPGAQQAAKYAWNMRATTERMDINWKWVQPKPGAQNMRWTKPDNEVAAIKCAPNPVPCGSYDSGMHPLIMIHDAPYWARPNTSCATQHCPPDANHLDDWATFARAVAQRYWDDNLAAIEVWNAPNTNAWWPVPGGPDPAQYANVFNWAANAIHKEADAHQTTIPVLYGSVGSNGFRDTKKNMSVPHFMSGFYSHVNPVALRPEDGFAIHDYPSKLDLSTNMESRFTRSLQEARDARQGDPEDPNRNLWITEIGMSTTWPDSDSRVTPEQQASGLVAALEKAWAQPDVAAIMTFTLVETAHDANHPEEKGYGIIARGSGTTLLPKPAYDALRCASASLRGLPNPSGC